MREAYSRSLGSNDDLLAKGIHVRQVTSLMRNMLGRNFFGVVHIGNGRHVHGGGSSFSYTGGPERPIHLTRTLSCACDPVWYWGSGRKGRSGWRTNEPIWTLEATYLADERYCTIEDDQEELDAIEDEAERSISIRKRVNWSGPWGAWYDDTLTGVSVSSSEGRRDFERDITDFVLKFDERKKSIRNLGRWHAQGLQVRIMCECGHCTTRNAQDFSERHPEVADIFALTPSLRCSACGTRGRASILPTYRSGFYAPGEVGYYERGNPSPERNEPEGADLYELLGGDGINKVYLGDDEYLGPDDGGGRS